MPKFSVVIPLYNKENTIVRALNSVLRQTVDDYEVIVVNDGSTDNSVQQAETVSDPRIRIIHQPNGGVSAARNRGIEEARGELIAFLDADDEWLPDFLETIAGLRREFPGCQVFATNYFMQTADGIDHLPLVRGLEAAEECFILKDYFRIACMSDPPLNSSNIVCSRNALQAIGGFPSGIKSGEDLLTWARLAANYSIAYSRKPCSRFYQDRNLIGSGRPSRIPENPDVVGTALARLAREHNSKPSIRGYVAFWHKMRASMFLRLGWRRRAIREILLALRHDPGEKKLYAFIILSMMPASAISFAFRRFSAQRTTGMGEKAGCA